jgi:hypothetical protein
LHNLPVLDPEGTGHWRLQEPEDGFNSFQGAWMSAARVTACDNLSLRFMEQIQRIENGIKFAISGYTLSSPKSIALMDDVLVRHHGFL